MQPKYTISAGWSQASSATVDLFVGLFVPDNIVALAFAWGDQVASPADGEP
jgi:hypothetical protein